MVTGAIYKGFVFDGIDSKQYGVYITGQGVFDAPVRDVEMIEIPGRNGSYALDKGRFKNIEVTYPAGMFGNTDGDFMQGISNLRNALASRKGYCRLTDEYNPNEYRMAVYKSGLEVSPAQLKAGQFDITFDCKPQRFLTSGETQTNVTSGATITNPTLFESHPLLLVDGYGDIDINGESITIQQGAVIGYIDIDTKQYPSRQIIAGGEQVTINRSVSSPLTNVALNGDNGTTEEVSIYLELRATGIVENIDITPAVSDNGLAYCDTVGRAEDRITLVINFYPMPFTVGQNKTETEYISIPCTLTVGGVEQTFNVMLQVYSEAYSTGVFYTGVIFYASQNPNVPLTYDNGTAAKCNVITYGYISINSTKSALGQLYIDLDIGECYRIENGQYISINTATTLPAELPVLKSGPNTITYDNTFTSFKITPRWWKV